MLEHTNGTISATATGMPSQIQAKHLDAEDQTVSEMKKKAFSYCINRQYDQAAKMFKSILSYQESQFGIYHQSLVSTLEAITETLCLTGEREASKEYSFRAYCLKERDTRS